MKKFFFWIALIVLPALALEGGCRVVLALARIGPARTGEKTFSERLGWVNSPGVHTIRVLKGSQKPVRYSTGRYGFRVFGDPGSTKKKILVLGDSFTDAPSVDDGRTYYDCFRTKDPDLELFACGVGGYGSLQEFMILDAYFDLIKPDLVLWQFSGNDLINNDPALEAASLMNNNHMTRPYWIRGRVEWRYPLQVPSCLYGIVNASSFIKYFSAKFGLTMVRFLGQGIESRLDIEHSAVKRSMSTTSQIMARVRQRVGRVPVVAFNANSCAWGSDEMFQKIASENGIYFIPGITRLIEEGRSRGLEVDGAPDDIHWRQAGHALAGQRIWNYIKEKKLLGHPAEETPETRLKQTGRS